MLAGVTIFWFYTEMLGCMMSLESVRILRLNCFAYESFWCQKAFDHRSFSFQTMHVSQFSAVTRAGKTERSSIAGLGIVAKNQ